MKRNRVIPLTLAALFVLTLTSCTGSLKKGYSVPEYSDPSTPAIAYTVDNEKPLGDTAIDIHYVVEKYFASEMYGYTLYDMAADIGIDCLRETEAGALYSVYNVKQGGRLYIFYQNFPDLESKDIRRWFYVQKNLSSQDFEKIKEGSSINDVKQIDPTVQLFINIYNANPDYWRTDELISWHYLTDGILEIGYKEEKGKLKVIGSIFHEDYQIDKFNDALGSSYDGHILPIDKLPD